MSNKKDTLVILTPGFPKDEADSNCLPERQVFLKALKRMYPAIHIIVLSFHYPYVRKKYLWNNIEVISFDGRNRGKHYKVITWLLVWQQLKKINREHKVIGLLSFWLGECAFLAKNFSAKYDIKSYYWLLGQDGRKSNKYFHRVKPNANSLIALSHFLVKEFEKNYQVIPAHVIPAGFDLESISDIKQERVFDVIGAGSLVKLKRYDVFVQIIHCLKEKFPKLKAAIVGDGPEMNFLDKMVKEYSLKENISLLGELPNDEVKKYMQRSKIFLHTSEYEGFGYVCLEALAAGCQVLSFCQPMNEPIKNWYVVNSANEMVDTIVTLLNNRELDHTPKMPFDVNKSAKKLMELYI